MAGRVLADGLCAIGQDRGRGFRMAEAMAPARMGPRPFGFYSPPKPHVP